MMKKTNCSRIVTLLHAHQSLIDGVREQGFGLAFTVDEMPTLSYAFPNIGREVEADPFDPYPQSVSRPDPDSPSMYIHSSGSTGSPKPIPQSHRFQTHRMIYGASIFLCLDPRRSYRYQWGSVGKADLRNLSPSDRIGVMALPPFHAYGVLIQLYTPLACLVTAVVYPPQAITDQRAPPIVPTSDNILDSVRRTHCKVVVTVPIFLEQWAASAEAIETLRKLDQIVSVVSFSALIDGTPDYVPIPCRFMAEVHWLIKSGMRCGLLVSTSVYRTAGQNLVLLSVFVRKRRLRMGNGFGCGSRRMSS